MSERSHTLNDLVDLALQTPEKGAVNFNILRVVILKIIEKLDFGREKVEYKFPYTRTSLFKLPEIKARDRLLIKDFQEAKVELISGKEPKRKKERKVRLSKEKDTIKETHNGDKIKIPTEFDSNKEDEERVKVYEEGRQPDSISQAEPEVIQDQKEPIQDKVVSPSTFETLSEEPEDSESESESSEEVHEGLEDKESTADKTDKSKLQLNIKNEDSEKCKKYSKETKDTEKCETSPLKRQQESEKRKSAFEESEKELATDKEQKTKQFKSSTWHEYQIKKLSDKINGIEDMINSVTSSINELMKFKEERERRTKFEEGEKLKSEYSSPYISREEFEGTIEDIGEALSRLFTNQRHQKEECNMINQNTLKELSVKVSVEDLNRHNEPISSKFRALGTALRNIQKLIKDEIYPETCGTTKCVACGRKAHLPSRSIVLKETKHNSEHKRNAESIIKRSKEENLLDRDLKFTKARLQKIEKLQKKDDQEVVHQDAKRHNIHQKRPSFPDYLLQIETLCDADKLSEEFAPLRYNTLCIPSVRPR